MRAESGGCVAARHVLGAAVTLVMLAGLALAGDGFPLGDAIKATFVYKFAPFVTWPVAPSSDAFYICSAGQDRVTSLLPRIVAGRRIEGKPVAVRTITGAEELGGCRIMYVANSKASAAMLKAARGKAILTVTQGAGADHGIIQFVTIQNHVRFDVDLTLASQSRLVISSKLLDLAHAVVPAQKGRG